MSSKGECHVLRPVANFSKNIWRDQFPSLPSSDSVFDSLTKEIIPLKEKVKEMLKASTADPMENVKFIDTLLRLGVSYHFENDIEMQLERIFNSQENLFHKNDYDLNSTSIAFRVSRLHGFKMSCGVFEKFKDGSVGKFKESLVDDIRGMLSLYEAAYLRVHGELILEEAIAFTKANLKPLAAKSSPHLAKQIMNALDNPLNKCPPRLEARNYISFYEEEESRNETLLTFAKLDFNRVQVLHRQEISQIARWEISALDELQDYTKVICKAVLDVFDEIEDEARKEGRSYTVPYAKDAFIGLINNYQAEVKWCHDGYVPTFEEYMRVAMKTSTYDPIITTSFIGMGTIAGLEAFEWLQTEPRIMTAANMIGRIMDDIASHKFEQLREHCPSSVECYMKQHNLSEKDALHDLKKKLEDGWKDINEECMRPTAIPRDLLLRILNFARVTYLFYKHGDGYTDPDPYMKDDIRALFVDPVRI
ncbi:hypothetical protein QUC31_002544 [Theobroma cacao]